MTAITRRRALFGAAALASVYPILRSSPAAAQAPAGPFISGSGPDP